MERNLIICDIGGGMEYSLNLIRKQGFRLIIISEKQFKLLGGDIQITESPLNHEVIIKKLNEINLKFHGVIPLGRERGVMLSALISKEFNLPGLSIIQSKILTNKYLLYRHLNKFKIPVPRTRLVSSYKELIRISSIIKFPIVIKPVNSVGAQGVIKVDSIEELKSGYEYAKKVSKKIIVQECLFGTEHSIEAVVSGDNVYITGFSDRNYLYKKYEPFFVEEGDTLPSELTLDEFEKIKELFIRAINSMGINSSVIKGDIILTKEGPKIIEIAGRLGSPNFWHLNYLSYGTNSLILGVNIACGEKIKEKKAALIYKKSKKGVIFKCIFCERGFFNRIIGLKKIRTMKGFYKFDWWDSKQPQKGDLVGNFENLSDMVAYVIIVGNSLKRAKILSEQILSKIKILVDKE